MEDTFTEIIALLSTSLGAAVAEVHNDPESKNYHGCSFKWGAHYFKYRQAKVTPKKIGQFVSLWKRNKAQKTVPYDLVDPVDFYLIATRFKEHLGCFIFPKTLLARQQILSNTRGEGKRGFRVYAHWDSPENPQAIKTKEWQSPYFVHLGADPKRTAAKVRFIMEQG